MSQAQWASTNYFYQNLKEICIFWNIKKFRKNNGSDILEFWIECGYEWTEAEYILNFKINLFLYSIFKTSQIFRIQGDDERLNKKNITREKISYSTIYLMIWYCASGQSITCFLSCTKLFFEFHKSNRTHTLKYL